jgi:hypothetical protein
VNFIKKVLLGCVLTSVAQAQLVDQPGLIWRQDYSRVVRDSLPLALVQRGQSAYWFDAEVGLIHEIDIVTGELRRDWGLPVWRTGGGVCFTGVCTFNDLAITNLNVPTPWIFRSALNAMTIFSASVVHQVWMEPQREQNSSVDEHSSSFDVFVRGPNRSYWLDYQTGQPKGQLERLDFVGRGLAISYEDSDPELVKINSQGEILWRNSLPLEIGQFAFNDNELVSVLDGEMQWRDLQTAAALTTPIALGAVDQQSLRVAIGVRGDVMLVDAAQGLRWFSRRQSNGAQPLWQRREIQTQTCRLVNQQVWCFGTDNVLRFDQTDGSALGSFSIGASTYAFAASVYAQGQFVYAPNNVTVASHVVLQARQADGSWRLLGLDANSGAIAWQRPSIRNRLGNTVITASKTGHWRARESQVAQSALDEQPSSNSNIVEKIAETGEVTASFDPGLDVYQMRSVAQSDDVLLQARAAPPARYSPDGVRLWQAPGGTQIEPQLFGRYLINDLGLVRLDTGVLLPLADRVIGADHRFVYTHNGPEVRARDPQSLVTAFSLQAFGVGTPIAGAAQDDLMFYYSNPPAPSLKRFDPQTGALLGTISREDWSGFNSVSRHGSYTLVAIVNRPSYLLDYDFQVVKVIPKRCKALAEQPQRAAILYLLCSEPQELLAMELQPQPAPGGVGPTVGLDFRTARYMLGLAVNPISSSTTAVSAVLRGNRISVVESQTFSLLGPLRLSQYAIEPFRVLPKLDLQILSRQGEPDSPSGAQIVLRLKNLSDLQLDSVRLQFNLRSDELRIQTTSCATSPQAPSSIAACNAAIRSPDRLKFLNLPANSEALLHVTVRGLAPIPPALFQAFSYLPLPMADDASGVTSASVALQDPIIFQDGFDGFAR